MNGELPMDNRHFAELEFLTENVTMREILAPNAEQQNAERTTYEDNLETMGEKTELEEKEQTKIWTKK